ncbi:MAG: hypothetical protein IJ520_02735 [Synergistaceae bacterium]|nr:hypothetical protein [Synergistaceae bacterium]
MLRRETEDYGNIHEWLLSEEFCSKFCDGCSAIRSVSGGLEEPAESVCDACDFDVSDANCLKSAEWSSVWDAADYFCNCVEEALNTAG